jgi:hypothetical protein
LRANASGEVTVSVVAKDDGGTLNSGTDASAAQNFKITINGSNDAPVITLPSAPTVLEDTAYTFTGASVITIEDDSVVSSFTVTLTAAHGTIQLPTDPSLVITGNGTNQVNVTGTLGNITSHALDGMAFTPSGNFNGSGASITVVANDGETVDPLSDTETLSFAVTAVNDAPMFTKGSDITLDEDSGEHSYSGWATNINAGPIGAGEDAQTIGFTVTAETPALFSKLEISSNGTLTVAPAANAFTLTPAKVTVYATDNGGTANNGQNQSASQDFYVTINGINDAPTMNAVADQTVAEDASEAILDLSGISAGPGGETGTVQVTVSTTSPIIASSSITDVSGSAAKLHFTPVSDQNGAAQLKVSLNDGELTSEYNVNVTVTAVNDAPSLSPIADHAVIRNSAATTVNLEGISAGPADETEAVTITATSSAPAIIPDPVVSYSSGSTGTLTFTPQPDATGEANITVTVDDGQPTNHTFSRTFKVSVVSTGVLVNPSGNLTTTEAGGTAQFAVSLVIAPTSNVTISLSSSNTAEGTVSASQLTFTTGNWNVPQTVTLTGVNDDVDDGNMAYQVNFSVSSLDGQYNGTTVAAVTATNTDNDTAGAVVAPTSGLVTSEAGQTASFTVRLLSRPTATVTVQVNSSDTSEGTVSPSTLTFAPAAWNTPQTVTITGANDEDVDGDIAYTVSFSVSSSDALYQGRSLPSVSVKNLDDEIVRQWITPGQGGSLSFNDPTGGTTTTITTPPGAVNDTVQLIFTPLSAPGDGSGYVSANHSYELGVYNQAGVQIPSFTFSKPVLVTLQYSDADVARLANENTLSLYRRTASGAWNWEPAACGTVTRDPVNNQITVPVCKSGVYALFGQNLFKVYLPVSRVVTDK